MKSCNNLICTTAIIISIILAQKIHDILFIIPELFSLCLINVLSKTIKSIQKIDISCTIVEEGGGAPNFADFSTIVAEFSGA